MYNILISGQKRSGKDYISNIIKSQYTDKNIIKFADKLYEVVKVLFNIDRDIIEKSPDLNIKEKLIVYNDKSLRFFLQQFGTEFIREKIGKNFWIDTLIQNNLQLIENNNAIIADVRFLNELNCINDYKNIKILILNNNTSTDSHSSETLLEPNNFDIVLDNSNKNQTLYYVSNTNDNNKLNYILSALSNHFKMEHKCH